MLHDKFEQLPTSIDTFTARHRHAAGIDVHKMQATVTLLHHQRDGYSNATTKTFSTLPSGQDALVAWLIEGRVDAAVMESTGIYWKATYEALEAANIPTRLVNAQHVKQLKGRKTDISDSQWLARVCQFELVGASFVPPRDFRELRQLSRHRRKLINQRSSVTNRVHKLLDGCGIQLGGILSDIFGKNGRRLLNGLIRGEARDSMLAALTRHVARKLEVIEDALAKQLPAVDRLLLADLVTEYDEFGVRIGTLDDELDRRLTPWREALHLLQTIPGIDVANARDILVEIGPDLSQFKNAAHLAAWAGVCPGNNESAGKRSPAKARRGNRHLRVTLVACAQAAARTLGCQFKGYHQGLMRRGYNRATMATAHKLLRTIYAVLRDRKHYVDPEVDYEALVVARNAPRWQKKLVEYGYLDRNHNLHTLN